MLLNPNKLQRKYPDARSGEIMQATVDFFENRGKAKLKHDAHERTWYTDFLNHIAENRIFASLLTPAEYGARTQPHLPLGHLPDQRVRRDHRLLRAELLVPVPGDRPGPGSDLDERQRGRQA